MRETRSSTDALRIEYDALRARERALQDSNLGLQKKIVSQTVQLGTLEDDVKRIRELTRCLTGTNALVAEQASEIDNRCYALNHQVRMNASSER
jgi:wobble nucleotide-excising tRNase